jgi:hypothetical protein
MAGKYTGTQRTYVAEDIIERYRGVTYGASEEGCKLPGADNKVFLGVIDNDSAPVADRDVAVKTDGYGEIELDGSCVYGCRLILADDGYAKRMPENPGVAEVTEITVNSVALADGDLTITLNGTDHIVAVDKDNTESEIATKIETILDELGDYGAVAADAVVTVTADTEEDQSDAEFDGGDTGVTVTIAVTAQGVNAGSGLYNIIGTAEKDGADREVVPFKIWPHIYYVA